MKKRGQVTIFIIIGIVILLGISGYVYLQQNNVIRDFFLPNEIKPIVRYAEACIERVGEDGIKLIGIQGGYINIPQRINANPQAYIDIGFKIPFWYYKGENRIPTRKDMEVELARYIDQNVHTCIDNFSAFPEFQLNDIEFSTSSAIGDFEVTTKTKADGSIIQKATGARFTFPLLQTMEEYNLGEMHKLANEIMEKENSDAFLESVTYDLIAASDYLPTEGLEIDCSLKSWNKRDIESYLKTLLMHNLQLVRYNPVEQPKVNIPYYDKQYTISLNENYKASVHTIYNPIWPLKLSITPNQGEIIRPFETVADTISFGCFKLYHHLYSLEYPVLYKLSSKQKADLSFFFATPVILTRNLPNRDASITLDVDELATEENLGYCNEDEEVTVFTVKPNGDIEDEVKIVPRRKNSLRVRALDVTMPFPQNAINDAKVSYQCAASRCEIGDTEFPATQQGIRTGESTMLNTKFPDCSNGFIIVEKQGYHRSIIQQSVSEQTNNRLVNVNMIPLKELVVNVLVKEEDEFRSLSPSEKALIIIKNDELNYNKQIFYPENRTTTLELLNAPATYNVEAILVENDVLKGKTGYNWTTSNIASAQRAVFFVPLLSRLAGESEQSYFARLMEYEEKIEAELR